MKKVFQCNLWDVIDIEALNNILDSNLSNGFAGDISYKFKEVTKNGTAQIEAEFEFEQFK